MNNTDKSNKPTKHTDADLKAMQGWDLNRKILVSQTRIMEWYMKHNNKCYISFSGGKDSTVLADIAAKVCRMLNCKLILWFSDTGLEFPEIKTHVKTFADWLREKYDIEVELITDYPKDKSGKRITFRDVVFQMGYPLISKEVAQKVESARNNPNGAAIQSFIEGSPKNLKYPKFKLVKYRYLLDAPFKISTKCCDVMKKKPAKIFEKETGLKPIIGTMACESSLRRTEWLKNGCNAFDNGRPISRPMSFWLEQDVLMYLKKYEIPYSSIYGEIISDESGCLKTSGRDRTGCMYCGFGCNLEKEPNRFQNLKVTHPKVWSYCMKSVDDGGLGMKEVLDYIGVKYE